MKRRTFLRSGVLAGSGMVLLPAWGQPTTTTADRIWFGGPIITMNDRASIKAAASGTYVNRFRNAGAVMRVEGAMRQGGRSQAAPRNPSQSALKRSGSSKYGSAPVG